MSSPYSTRRAQAGSGTVEYALIIAVVSLVLVLNLVPIRGGVCSVTDSVTQLLGGSSASVCPVGGSPDGQGNGGGNQSGHGNGTGLGNGGPAGGG